MKALIIAAVTLILVNCAQGSRTEAVSQDKNGAFEVSPTPTPEYPALSMSGIDQMTFRHWGGMPGPGYSNDWELSLVLQNDGTVTAHYNYRSCRAQARFDRDGYERIAHAILKSPKAIGVGSGGADMGSRTVGLYDSDPRSGAFPIMHLGEDESSSGYFVLADHEAIHALVQQYGAEILQKCRSK